MGSLGMTTSVFQQELSKNMLHYYDSKDHPRNALFDYVFAEYDPDSSRSLRAMAWLEWE